MFIRHNFNIYHILDEPNFPIKIKTFLYVLFLLLPIYLSALTDSEERAHRCKVNAKKNLEYAEHNLTRLPDFPEKKAFENLLHAVYSDYVNAFANVTDVREQFLRPAINCINERFDVYDTMIVYLHEAASNIELMRFYFSNTHILGSQNLQFGSPNELLGCIHELISAEMISGCIKNPWYSITIYQKIAHCRHIIASKLSNCNYSLKYKVELEEIAEKLEEIYSDVLKANKKYESIHYQKDKTVDLYIRERFIEIIENASNSAWSIVKSEPH